jgi:hypothetical protein
MTKMAGFKEAPERSERALGLTSFKGFRTSLAQR